MVVQLLERPSIAQIDFTGVKEFDKDTVTKALRQIGLQPLLHRGIQLMAARQELVELVESGRIKPCKAIDLGSGTASNCVFLAQRGFDVTGESGRSAPQEDLSVSGK